MVINESVEVYQDISFEYPREKSQTLRDFLKRRCSQHWHWDPNWEEELKKRADYDSEVIAFARDSYDQIGAAYVHLWNASLKDWTIPNVVPQKIGDRFNVYQYNDIIDDFVQLLLKPVLDSLQTELDVSSRRVQLSDFMSKASRSALHAFLTSDTVCATVIHPHDEQRLCQFIWSLHEGDTNLDVDLFCRWLEEANSWPRD